MVRLCESVGEVDCSRMNHWLTDAIYTKGKNRLAIKIFVHVDNIILCTVYSETFV